MKKVIVFDLDETLTETTSPITDEMSLLLDRLLEIYQVCVISGGNITQFKKQFIDYVKVEERHLKSLHLMPTCGTRYFNYNLKEHDWEQIYAEEFLPSDKKKIIKALEEAIDQSGYRIGNPTGPLIEDRGSQITYKALGRDAGPAAKKAWDPTGIKKKKVRDIVASKIPEFEVRVGGTTSVDITKKGIDKAYGMKKLMEILNVKKEEILFIGDRLFEGGNDYPVKLLGIDTIAVSGYEHTPWVVRGILAVS
jgi:HAD superfamily hydrolase (TIGR01484 family)